MEKNNQLTDLPDEYVNEYIGQHVSFLNGEREARRYLDIYADHIMANSLLKSGSKLLYLGCGTGGFFHLFNNVSEIVGIDSSLKMTKVAEKPPLKELIKPGTKIRAICADWTKYNFNGEKFDAVWASTLSVYLPYKEEYVQKLSELVLPGGYLFVPIRVHEKEKNIFKSVVFQVRCSIKRLIRHFFPDILPNPVPITCFGERSRIEKMFEKVCEKFLLTIEARGNIVLIYRR